MTRVLMRHRFGRLVPVDDDGKTLMGKLKDDQIVTVEVKRARNPRQHRLYWAAIDLCWQYQETYATREQLHNAIKVALGYYDEIQTSKKVIAVPKSIAFGNMPQDEWEDFFNKFLDFIAARIIPNTTSDELRQELEIMIGGQAAA